jgi:hypothetical protein
VSRKYTWIIQTKIMRRPASGIRMNNNHKKHMEGNKNDSVKKTSYRMDAACVRVQSFL